ncbi:MAG TPA: dihydroorotase, partial [Myxococcaceae bacterium]|nr:dihydroorotase [Myxococcaceae bacterium]
LTGCRAAVAGGFTAVAAMPNTRPVNDSTLVTRLIRQRAAEADLARVYPVGAISKGLLGEEMAEIGALRDAGCVAVTDDGRPVMSASLMRRVLVYTAPLGLPVMVHEEDLTLSAGGALTDGPRSTRLGLLPIPRSAEVVMVARDLVLLEEVGGRLHVAHLSCAASVALVREAKRRGLRVTAEAAPHHFTLTDEAVEGWDTHAKMNPPLRHPEDVAAIREGLADGTIDAIATDHAPHGVMDKQVPYAEAANGVIGLETALPLTLELVRSGVLTPTRAVELLTSGPAAAFGLPGGHLGPGAPADLTLVDPGAEWTVESARFQSKSRNTPYEGRRVTGRVVRTVVGGRTVWPLEERR